VISKTALSPDEIAFAQAIINDKRPGFYTIQEVFGSDYYEYILDKNGHGMRFKASVRAGELTGLRWDHDQSDHIAVYEIDRRRFGGI